MEFTNQLTKVEEQPGSALDTVRFSIINQDEMQSPYNSTTVPIDNGKNYEKSNELAISELKFSKILFTQ
jgi:hypothetical protein